jgi:hypothetical protein
MRSLAIAIGLATPAAAGPLSGQSYIIEMSSSQSASGYGDYLLTPLIKVMEASGLVPHRVLGPGADIVVNVVTDSDVGAWMGDPRVWTYTISATVGLSPESYAMPYDGTPAFGVRAVLQTPNPDRMDEMDCLISLAARTAIANYRATGILKTNGQSCLRAETLRSGQD